MSGTRVGALAPVLAIAALLAATPTAMAVAPSFALGPDGQATPMGNGLSELSSDLCPGNFDGDGNPDVGQGLVISVPNGVYVSRGDGTGHFPAFTNAIPTSGQTHCAAGDVNGDGLDDILASNDSSTSVTISLAQPNGVFATTPVATGLTGGTDAVAIADLDQNGKPDLIAGSASGGAGNFLSVMLGDGAGGFAAGVPYGSAPTTPPAFPGAARLRVTDMNGDGRPDPVVMADNFHLYIGFSNADGTITPPVDKDLAEADVAIADFTGDAKPDLIYGGGNKLNVVPTDGSGNPDTLSTEQYPSGATPMAGGTRSVAQGDFNGDGEPDAAIGEGTGAIGGMSKVWAFPGTGSATSPFLGPIIGPMIVDTTAARNIDSLFPYDVNNDGRLDLLVRSDAPQARFAVLLNTTPIPGVKTGAPSSVGDTVATVTATVDTGGLDSQFGIDLLGPGGSFIRQAAAGTLSGTGTQGVSIPVSGLSTSTLYRYRAYATNANGTTVSPVVQTFTTGIARPVNTVPPGISGDAVPGRTLTCTPGAFSGDPTSVGLQWLRNGVPIAGDNGQTHAVTNADINSALSCRVTAVNSGGSASADTASLFVVPLAVTPANVVAPRLGGTAAYKELLACDAGSWSAGGTFRYQWLANNSAIAGATGSAYRVAKKDIGKQLRCRVTLTNAAGTATATSAAKTVARPPCVVPDVRGQTVKDAHKAILAGGCANGRTVRVKGTGVAKGRVLSTRPKAGTRAKGGTKVTLNVRGS